MHNVSVTKRFYLDYLGCTLDAQDGEGDRTVFMKVSRGGMRLHLSSHHDDGTPGTVVLVVASDVADLHTELVSKNFPFLNPGLERGPGGAGLELQLIDPASKSAALLRAPLVRRASRCRVGSTSDSAGCSPEQHSPVRHRALPERIGASRLKPQIVQ